MDIIKRGINCGSVDTFENLLIDRKPFIINTDISTGAGIHWITLILVDEVVYIIDSLGKNNVRPYDNIMFKIIKEKLKTSGVSSSLPFYRPAIKPDNNYKVKIWNGEIQYADNIMCGYFAIYIAKLLKNEKIKNGSDVFKIIDGEFGKTADDGDIVKVLKLFRLH